MLPIPPHIMAKIMKIQGISGKLTSKLPAPLLESLAKALGYQGNYPTLNAHLKLLIAIREQRDARLVSDDVPRSRRHFRQEMDSIVLKPTTVSGVRNFSIDGAAGKIRLRHYQPANHTQALPLLLFIHGGGFVVGDLDTHDEPCRMLCKYGQMHVLSVDYRLAPEHQAPAAAEDCVTALRWVYANTDVLGVDPNRIAVGGDSAGGNLSAVVSQMTAGTDVAPAAQLLIYPVVDLSQKYSSHDTYSQHLFLSKADMAAATRFYTEGCGITLNHPQISPLYGKLEQVAPALVLTAEFDVLRDEGELYAKRLQEAGNQAIFYRVAGQGHGFINISAINPQAYEASKRMAQDFRQLLDRVQRPTEASA